MKYFLIFFYFALFAVSNAQNFVPNPSFEDTVNCPTSIGQLSMAKYWINPTQSTPDFFNVCSTANADVVHIPDNGFGYQVSHTGNGYAGLYAFNKSFPNIREYIQTKLTDTLLLGHKYLISFYVNLSNWSQYSISSLGAYFSSNPISSTGTLVLNYTPQIQNNSSVQLSDSVNWMLVEDTLVANGTEEYITIGNFRSDSQSDTSYIGSFSTNNIAYYYIDDVSVIDVLDLGINETASIGLKIFPNPANSILNIEAKLQNAEIKIYDMLGNETLIEKLSYKKQVNISQFPAGLYFLQILDKGRVYSTKFLKE